MANLLPIPVAMMVAGIAIYYDISYIGFGVLIGVALSLFSNTNKESRKGLVMGMIMIVCALIGFAYSWYLTGQYNLSFVELSERADLPQQVHAAPYFSVAFLTAGVVDLLHYWLIGKDKEKQQADGK